MTTGMFLRSGMTLAPLDLHPLTSEDELQELVEQNPQLLAVCFGEEPSSWLLVRREAGVPLTESGGDQFSLDHFLVTASAIPVLVEVKRASNREIRRQIVGQMLDYAANASRYWPTERIKEWFAETHGVRADDRLLDCCGGDTDADSFWAQVSTNLRAGRMRLVFVADGIPPELQAIVEFLSQQMIDAEVAAIRIQQFGEGDTAAVAAERVGNVTAAAATAQAAPKVPLPTLLDRADDSFKRALARVEEWATGRGLKTTAAGKSRRVVLSNGQGALYLYPEWRTLEVRIRPIRRGGRADVADEIAALVGGLAGGKASDAFPSVPVDVIANNWEQTIPVLDTIITKLEHAYADIATSAALEPDE